VVPLSDRARRIGKADPSAGSGVAGRRDCNAREAVVRAAAVAHEPLVANAIVRSAPPAWRKRSCEPASAPDDCCHAVAITRFVDRLTGHCLSSAYATARFKSCLPDVAMS